MRVDERREIHPSHGGLTNQTEMLRQDVPAAHFPGSEGFLMQITTSVPGGSLGRKSPFAAGGIFDAEHDDKVRRKNNPAAYMTNITARRCKWFLYLPSLSLSPKD